MFLLCLVFLNPLFYSSLSMPGSSRKHPPDKTESIYYSIYPYANLHTLTPWNIIWNHLIQIFKHFETLSWSTVGMPWSSRNHPFHETESIYWSCGCILIWKKHHHPSRLWNIILKHFNIKILILAYPGITLIKNYIDMWLLWIYIHKHNLNKKYIDMWILWIYIHKQKIT